MAGKYLETPVSWLDGFVNHFIPASHADKVTVLHPPEFSKIPSFKGTIEEALDMVLSNPIGGSPTLKEIIEKHHQRGKPVVIAVDDYTRPNIHTKILLPLVIERLVGYGVREDEIRILMATGTHRQPKPEEFPAVVGEQVWEKFKDQVIAHDCEKDVVMIGKSDAGTPMGFNKLIFDCTVLVPLTDSELHYFAGVAGTIKEICPGIAARETVSRNHPKMFDPEHGFVPGCRLGNTEGNPVITDIKNMVSILKQKVRIFGIDTIVTDDKIVYINAGDLIALHDVAKEKIVAMRTVTVPEAANLVISGTQTWGINLYQAGKGLHAAWNGVKRNGEGQIILIAPCPDGVGNPNYQKTMSECAGKDLQEAMGYVLENYCDEKTFKIGNQKPVDLLRIIKTVGEGNVKIISDMDPEELRRDYRLVPVKKEGETPQDALRREVAAFLEQNPDGTIFVLDDPGLNIVVSGNGVR